ncbi:hypothetical protein MAR_011552 [Mya arenaria]|uniref:Uncharacterized protein n=1 Tax=Mya arenaria TaxID=6604 RepID=A0ABY7FUE1_MYAAR|nr:hypothetical protein MAR_011552 [Mya arenaria]
MDITVTEDRPRGQATRSGRGDLSRPTNRESKGMDSRKREVSDCMQDILDRCRGSTDAEQILHKLIDKDKTMATVDYFCRHIQLYERHQACISSHHEEVSFCTQAAQKSFKSKLDAGAKMDVLIMGSCSFFFIARGCLTNTTEQFCGGEPANFVHTLMTGYMPPYCETHLPEDSTRGRWGSPGGTYNTGDGENGATTSHVRPFSILTVFTIILTVSLTNVHI